MGRSLIQVYALCVCFCTLMCFVVALGIGLYDVVQVAAPEFTMSWAHEMYRSADQYLAYYPDRKTLPPAEVERLRQAGYRDAVAAERRGAWQSLIFASVIVLIDVGVYAAHWRIARSRDRRGPAALPAGEASRRADT